MSEFSFPTTNNKKTATTTHFSALLLSDLFLFCSFIISHPLYFSYFIFFSPYLFKLLSFLSPLFITTSLLVLALVTNLVHESSHMDSSESKVSFFVTTYHRLVESLQSKVDDKSGGFHCFEELEAYKIVFETCTFEIGENPDEVLEVEAKEKCPATTTCNGDAKVDRCSSSDSFGTGVSEVLNDELEEYQFEITRPEITQLMAGVKRLECFLQEKEEPEESLFRNEAKEVELLPNVEDNKVVEEQNGKSMRRAIHEAQVMKVDNNGGEPSLSKLKLNSQRLRASFRSTDSEGDFYKSADNSPKFGANLGGFGSMRKEREWRRTLACKLFEERHNVNGSEGMDMLWETYETDSSNKVQQQQSKSNTKKKKKSSSNSINDLYDHVVDHEEEEEIDDGQFCCLQALKFSAGKMNLGMGRPNLVKISKALKGIGWLHSVSRHGKKLYH